MIYIYFKNKFGVVFAYETQADREQFGAPDLVPMTQAEVEAHIASNDQIPQAPTIVTMRQARLALHADGLLSQVETAIDALPEPQRSEARIEWDYASEVHRSSEFVGMMGAALSLDDDALDALFVTAAGL